MKRLVVKLVFSGPLAYDHKSGYRTAQPSGIFKFLSDFYLNCEMVRSERISSNAFDATSGTDPAPDFDEMFTELERWHEQFKDHRNKLRGPRP